MRALSKIYLSTFLTVLLGLAFSPNPVYAFNPSITGGSLVQSDSAESPISTGDYISDTTLVFKADIFDPDANPGNPNYIWLEIEVEPLGTTFNDTNDNVTCIPSDIYEVTSSSAVTAKVTCNAGFLSGTSYHWQAIVKDVNASPPGTLSYGGNPENQADFIIDTTNPTVSSTTPTDGGSLFIDAAQDITVDFNAGENLDCSTVNISSVSIARNSDSNPVTLSIQSCSATQIVIDPDEADPDLVRFETYTVTLTSAITDLAGNQLNGGVNETFGFTTQETGTAPNPPASLRQLRTDDSVIPENGFTNETTVKFEA
ncbi:MAG: Ig-like domain-containing domain, partial [Planctomycetota bacterium]